MSSINLQGSNQGCHSFSISCSSTIIAWCHLLIFKAATRASLIFYFVQLYYHCLMSSINLQGSNQGCHSFSISCSSTIIAWCHLLIFKAATRAPLIFYFVQLYYHCLMSSINLQGSNQGCHSFSISCSSTIIAWCHLLIFKAATRAATHFLFRAALLSLLDVIY